MTVLSTMNRLLISGMIIINVSQGGVGVFDSIFGSSLNKKHCESCLGISGWREIHYKLPPADCGDHGQQIKGREWDCVCDLGWRGRLCDEEIPCDKVHGEVKMVNAHGDIRMPECVCKNDLYGGHDCSVFCQNGLAQNGKCHCDAGFGGKSCGVRCDHGEIEIIENKEKCVCQNGYGGVYCHDTQCSNGRTGRKCRKKVECGRSPSHGHTTPNGCKCNKGWAGRYCTVEVKCDNGRLLPNGLDYVCDEESSDSMDGTFLVRSLNPKGRYINRNKGPHSMQSETPVLARMEITSEVNKSMDKTAQSSFNERIQMFISRLIQKISNVINRISESIIEGN